MKQNKLVSLHDGFKAVCDAVRQVESAVYSAENVGLWSAYFEQTLAEIMDSFDGSRSTGFEGVSGGNRYTVKKDGSVWLSVLHSNSSHLCVAVLVGVGLEEYGYPARRVCPCGSQQPYKVCHNPERT